MKSTISVPILLVIWSPLLWTGNAANILILFPYFVRSHLAFHTAIARSLQAAGHHITVVHPFSQDAVHQNFTFIDATRPDKPEESNFVPVNEVLQITNSVKMIIMLTKDTEIDCHQTIRIKEIQQILQSKEKQFDVIIADLVGSMFECFLPIAEILQIPFIGTVGARSWRNNEQIMGNPYNPAIVPMEMSSMPPKMNFIQRSKNAWICIFDILLHSLFVYPKVEAFYEKHFPDLSFRRRIKPALLLVNDHPVFVPRPVAPNVVYIGGIHLTPAKPLPKNLQEFMDDADHGVILFTLGSLVKMFPKNSKEVHIFKTVFAQIPQRVIWKSEEEIEDLPSNVLVSKWLPQRDILAHKNLITFISHCGLSGIYEAVFEGKPLIMLPTCFDQMSNAAVLANLGVGLVLDAREITANGVLDALNSVINDSTYRKRMQTISNIIKNAPMTPQESVVYWTEYIIRHKGAEHLRTSEADMAIHQDLLFYLLIFLFAILLFFSLLVNRILKKVYLH